MIYDIDEFEDMTDEEIDAFYRPKKKNNRKSLLPLFVYLILEKFSSEDRPLHQQEIIDILAERPYEITIERKALGRVIHSLADSDLGIKSDARRGTWLE